MFTRRNANFMWRSIVLFLARGWTFPSSVTWNAVKTWMQIMILGMYPISCFFFPISPSIEQAFLFKILQYKMTVYLTCTMAV